MVRYGGQLLAAGLRGQREADSPAEGTHRAEGHADDTELASIAEHAAEAGDRPADVDGPEGRLLAETSSSIGHAIPRRAGAARRGMIARASGRKIAILRLAIVVERLQNR